jgi:hypothetical protein
VFVKELGQFELYGNWVLFCARKEIGLEVNADKTKYMIMFREQNAERSYSIKAAIIVPWKVW